MCIRDRSTWGQFYLIIYCNTTHKTTTPAQPYPVFSMILSETPIISYNSHHEDFPKEKMNQCHLSVPVFENNIHDKLQTNKQKNPPLILPQFNQSLNYYQEFWRLYLQNEYMLTKMVEFQHFKSEIHERIQKLEMVVQAMEAQNNSPNSRNQKRKFRRTAAEITKSHPCPYPGCCKTYGSDVSLNLHIKLKHNGGNKTERERAAELIYSAKLNGQNAPSINLNLPPGFVEVKLQIFAQRQ
eukprot:TRINITY_DN1525_c0_g2_i1.p1 TRINITY_DN1525_c0_g2~~TRINITY_DN1525_c0_g2_i1.p1  ORF type:complete len:268 (-),score=34.82 TRINITY_DN1525_c0_g2_i1:462-1181(-)